MVLLGTLRRDPSVDISKSYNIVFPQVGASLHFDELERLRAGVGEAMFRVPWDVRPLVRL